MQTRYTVMRLNSWCRMGIGDSLRLICWWKIWWDGLEYKMSSLKLNLGRLGIYKTSGVHSVFVAGGGYVSHRRM